MNNKQCFKKTAVFGDIHFGLKNDSKIHNEDCERFITWYIQQAKDNDCEIAIFVGDWHHNRARTNVSTFNYSLDNIMRISEAFEHVYFITGNHDLYYRDNRDLNSIEFGRIIDNVTMISEPIVYGDVAFIPWLNGDEWKTIKDIKCKYMFGHFELPNFKMNQMVSMPDNGQLQDKHFIHPEYVFSGHFHKRQQKGKVHYIGNPFPHNFADVNDDERGMMILEWGEKPKYIDWDDAPRYRKTTLTELLKQPEFFLNETTFARVELDFNPTYEEITYIKDLFLEEYKPRDLVFLPATTIDEDTSDYINDLNFESIDSVVLSHLENVNSVNIDNKTLMKIYRAL